MKKKFLLLLLSASAFSFAAKAQDTIKTTQDAPLTLYGSVDTYYKDDFSGHANIPTSFGSDNNSISLGMFDLGLKKSVGNASFEGEVSFGPRADASLSGGGSGTSDYHIQNLFVSYNLTSKLNATAGYMSTFIGYEVISPTGNFNYSTSYLFTNGPFENAGFKLTYAFSGSVSLMAGIFNDQWNAYRSTYDVSTFGAQLTLTPVKNFTAYLNVASGPVSGTELDADGALTLGSSFKLGFDAATYTPAHYTFGAGNTYGFSGIALYPQLAVSKNVTVGLREEYFKINSSSTGDAFAGPAPGGSVIASTLSLNIKSGPFTFIPEVRFDSVNKLQYSNFSDSTFNPATNSYTPSTSATQFLLAAVYAF
jgi:hypothetical protein